MLAIGTLHTEHRGWSVVLDSGGTCDTRIDFDLVALRPVGLSLGVKRCVDNKLAEVCKVIREVILFRLSLG